ncbi:hypothetical protein AB0J80_11480 [Actinoplanes sp. NPDC049548]|uniref:hypothetical protein n=1 Tax=Actinoplanes sp. NPDC049548 TaxID=3155152 RepID=UPI00342F6635
MARAAFALGDADTGRAELPFREPSGASGKNAERSPAGPAGPLVGAELGTAADPETGAELGTEADPETGAELGTEADPETGAVEVRTFAEPEADPDTGLADPAWPEDAHRAPAAGGGGSSYP